MGTKYVRVLIGAAGAVAVLAGCGSVRPNVSSSPVTAVNAPAATTKPAAKPVAKTVAHVGDTVKVSGGTVTLVKITDPAAGADQYLTADPGTRFVGVEITVTAGSQSMEGDADGDMTVTGSDNQTYTASFDPVAGCTNFVDGAYTLAAGEKTTGCVAFQVPTGVTVSKALYSPDDGVGFGSTDGEWTVP